MAPGPFTSLPLYVQLNFHRKEFSVKYITITPKRSNCDVIRLCKFDCCISDYYDVISALRCATLSGNWPVHRPIWSVTMSAIEPNLLLMNDYDIDGRGCHSISLIAPLIQSALKHVQYA